ncbi:MAG: hypothetical protein KME27_15420 [Lyngbya sp. HA4199-MV5]|jgi:uncharacterized protein YjbJ (UPF0337 family)|nr:hypothetical protein [Lyngbya sp. HA4199-MV5]
MKLKFFAGHLTVLGRFLTTALLCVSAIAFAWQGALFSNTAALASPNTHLIAAADAGSEVQGKASKDAGRTKGFVRDTTDKLKKTAKTNAAKVDRATDNDSAIARKAKKDAARIERKADKDSARTQNAIDKTKRAVEGAVDNIKDAFGK